MTKRVTVEPDEAWPWLAFNEPYIDKVDGKPFLFMLAEDKELERDVEVLVIEITDDMTEKKARKLAAFVAYYGTVQAYVNEEAGL